MHRPTERLGLYDPAYEHDSCGVAFVARLDGIASHETVRRALTALENLEHRGAAGADADSGDGAGILAQVPDRLFRISPAPTCRGPGAYGIGVCFLPQDEARRPEVEAIVARAVEAEGQQVVLWRDVPVDVAHVGAVAGAAAPCICQVVVAASPELARRSGRLRAQALRDPARGRARGRPRARRAELLVAHGRLQGDAERAAARPLLPRPRGRALRDRACARALPLLDEHVPELGARPSVPDARPQRRDQHAPGQRQLDAGARVAARLRALRRRPRQGLAGRAAGRLRLGDLRQRPRAPRPRRPLAAARDHDDGARGLRGPRRRLTRAGRLLRLPRLPDRGLGRAGRARLHRRSRDRRDARPKRAPAGALARDARRLGRSRLRDRRARRGARERASEGAAPARQALPRRPRPGADRRTTPRSSASSRRGGRTPSGTSRRSCGSPTCRGASRSRGSRSRFAASSSRSATRRRT